MLAELYAVLLQRFAKDHRLTVWHLATMLAILQLATKEDTNQPIYISRLKVMELAHIGSIATYHKCIRELEDFGYIDYIPSYHPGIRTEVWLKIRPDKKEESR